MNSVKRQGHKSTRKNQLHFYTCFVLVSAYQQPVLWLDRPSELGLQDALQQ